MSTLAIIGMVWAAVGAGALIGWGSGWRQGYTAAIDDVMALMDEEGR